VFENRVLRRIFDWDGQIKEDEISGACGETRSSDNILVRKAEGRRPLVLIELCSAVSCDSSSHIQFIIGCNAMYSFA
jgi:hypothetical protein